MNIEQDKEILRRLLNSFPQSFINDCNEFICCPKINTYFCLNGIDEFVLKCKIFEYLSRPAHKGEYYVTAKANQKIYDYHLNGINSFLGTSFTPEDMATIYQPIGNGCNRSLCEKFVRSGYDLNVIRRI